MNGVRSRTVRVNSRSSSVVYGAAHIRTKCEKAGNPTVESQIFHMGQIRGYTGKGDDTKENRIRKAPAVLQHGGACKELRSTIRNT